MRARRAPPVSGSARVRQRADGGAEGNRRPLAAFEQQSSNCLDLERLAMRALLLILIVAVVAGLIAFGTGFLKLNQTRGAKAPEVSTTSNGVTAKGGQAPAFDVETGSVKV